MNLVVTGGLPVNEEDALPALPAGTVRVYQRDARGNPQFVGEHRIGHTPMGSDIGLTTGQAFDVKVRPVVEERTRLSSSRWRTRMAVVSSCREMLG